MEMLNEEEFQLQCLRRLVQRLTTSGCPSLDDKQMKSLKKICKSSNKYVEYLFKHIIKQLKMKHAEIRLSAFQICHEIFMRSHCFRQLISDNLNTVYNLTILINKNGPILKPVQVAEKLKSTAISSLHIWYENFGDGYIYLKDGYNYLKDVENVDYESASISTEQDRRRREERLRKEEEIKTQRIQNVLNEMESSSDDINNVILEFNNTFKLLIPDLNNFFINTNGDTFENHYVDNTSQEDFADENFEYGSDLMRGHGLIKETVIQVNLSKIHEVDETTDNDIIISTLKEQVYNIKNKLMPNVKKWEQSVMKYSPTEKELILKIIDIKRSFDSILSRYKSIKIIPRGKEKEIVKVTGNKVPEMDSSDDDDDDFIDVPFDDPRITQASDLEAAYLGLQTSSLKENLKDVKISSEDLNEAGSSGIKHTVSIDELKKKKSDLSIDNFMEDTLQSPVKVSHSIPGLTNIWSGNEVLHDHGEHILKPTEMLGIATRAVDFQQNWEPVRWECRAPLPSGRLCPRKDRERCPLHGIVIPRDNLGVPINVTDAQKEQQKRDEYERANPEWQNPTLLAEIRAATGVDLDMKKAKKKKRLHPNLTNIRELENTPYNRLKKKVFSKKSVRRINKALAKLDQ